MDENATEWDGVRPTPEATPEPVGIKIPGYPTISLPANTTNVFLGIMNPEGNPCYFTYTLYLKNTEEIIYTSKMVAPGKSITEATLNRALTPGEYPAVLNISTNSLTDGSPMNGANMETVLVVK